MVLKPGTALERGKYRIDTVLGQGGFGITYLGEQIYLGRKVAIKEFFMEGLCVRDESTQTVTAPADASKGVVERFRRKFIKEAQNIAHLKHRGIVPIIDIFEENGTAYYVMEYLSGGSLSGMVGCTALPQEAALRYIRQVAAALGYVHSQRMMHLDIKPANILIDSEDNAVLIDFGLSKQYDSAGQQTSTTPVGISHGYAPLEQYKQGGVEQFTPATDIYSLGATLYKLVTGVTPPDASDIMNMGLPSFSPMVSSAVQNAIIKAMQPVVKTRPQSVKEFLALLDVEEKVVQQQPVTKPVEKKQEKRVVAEAVVNDENSDYNAGKVSGVNAKSLLAIAVLAILLFSLIPSLRGCGSDLYVENIDTNRRVVDSLTAVHKHYKDSVANAEIKRKRQEASRIVAEKARKEAEEKEAERKRQEEEKRIAAERKLKEAVEKEAERVRQETALVKTDGVINGHKYVDLGLPSGLKWATCNVGASSPEDYGKYYAWGEISTKGSYTDSNSVTSGRKFGNIGGNAQYDVARASWGASWRLPTKAEFEELLKEYNCTWIWTTQDGKNGYKVISKKNGNSIFIPVAGNRGGTSLNRDGSYGYYWSSTPAANNTSSAYCLRFNSNIPNADDIASLYRYSGRSVRPVSE